MAYKKKLNTQDRHLPKMHVKKGDKVVVVAGSYKDKSKVREVLEVIPSKNRVVVDGVAIMKRHTKPTQDNPGGIIESPAPIHVSNVMLVDPKTGAPTRIGRKKDASGKSVRYSKKSGEIIQ